jgi:hypothetical protein
MIPKAYGKDVAGTVEVAVSAAAEIIASDPKLSETIDSTQVSKSGFQHSTDPHAKVNLDMIAP